MPIPDTEPARAMAQTVFVVHLCDRQSDLAYHDDDQGRTEKGAKAADEVKEKDEGDNEHPVWKYHPSMVLPAKELLPIPVTAVATAAAQDACGSLGHLDDSDFDNQGSETQYISPHSSSPHTHHTQQQRTVLQLQPFLQPLSTMFFPPPVPEPYHSYAQGQALRDEEDDSDDDYWGQYGDAEDESPATEESSHAFPALVMVDTDVEDGDEDDDYWRKYALEHQGDEDKQGDCDKPEGPSAADASSAAAVATGKHDAISSSFGPLEDCLNLVDARDVDMMDMDLDVDLELRHRERIRRIGRARTGSETGRILACLNDAHSTVGSGMGMGLGGLCQEESTQTRALSDALPAQVSMGTGMAMAMAVPGQVDPTTLSMLLERLIAHTDADHTHAHASDRDNDDDEGQEEEEEQAEDNEIGSGTDHQHPQHQQEDEERHGEQQQEEEDVSQRLLWGEASLARGDDINNNNSKDSMDMSSIKNENLSTSSCSLSWSSSAGSRSRSQSQSTSLSSTSNNYGDCSKNGAITIDVHVKDTATVVAEATSIETVIQEQKNYTSSHVSTYTSISSPSSALTLPLTLPSSSLVTSPTSALSCADSAYHEVLDQVLTLEASPESVRASLQFAVRKASVSGMSKTDLMEMLSKIYESSATAVGMPA